MSRVFSWGYERGYVKGNPCKGVRKFSLKSRDVYVTDEEYQTIYEEAAPALRVGMEISYLCAARVSDVISLKWSQVREEGIFIQQGKTGTKQIKVWTERLHNAIELAKTLGGRETVICSSKKLSIRKVDLTIFGKQQGKQQEKNLIENCYVHFMISKPRGYQIMKGLVRINNYSLVTKLRVKLWFMTER